jgi:hypothetical protein
MKQVSSGQGPRIARLAISPAELPGPGRDPRLRAGDLGVAASHQQVEIPLAALSEMVNVLKNEAQAPPAADVVFQAELAQAEVTTRDLVDA